MPNRDIKEPSEYQQNNYHTQFNYHFPEHHKINESGDTDALKSLYKIALETRNFEITQLVQRNNFFMIFQGVAFAGLAQSSHTVPVVSFMLCLSGLLVSLYQTGMASGAKFWQAYWEAALSNIERNMLKHINDSEKERKLLFSLFHNNQDVYTNMVKNGLRCKGNSFTEKLIMRRFSVSKIPILVGVSLSIIWLLLLLCTLRAYPPLGIPSFIIGL